MDKTRHLIVAPSLEGKTHAVPSDDQSNDPSATWPAVHEAHRSQRPARYKSLSFVCIAGEKSWMCVCASVFSILMPRTRSPTLVFLLDGALSLFCVNICQHPLTPPFNLLLRHLYPIKYPRHSAFSMVVAKCCCFHRPLSLHSLCWTSFIGQNVWNDFPMEFIQHNAFKTVGMRRYL